MDTRFQFRQTGSRLARAACMSAFLLIAAACGQDGGGAPPGRGGPAGPGAGPSPMTVQLTTLELRPVEQTTEFLGNVRSRRSTTIQPQVEGLVTRIVARSGDRVRPGASLMEIDSGRQQATVASLESQRAAREADVLFARQQAERLRTLYDAGAVSLQELEQAQSALAAGEAQMKAIDAQIREQRVELGYHRVTAPTAGVVGDIPVRVGDRVTSATVLTTIDDDGGLEVYVNVPVQQATSLKPGLPVRILDQEDAVLAERAVTFVSPHVDQSTQSVLVKAALKSGAGFRTNQFVRVQMIWSTHAGVTVPLVAVNRISGQYFAFVAEPGEGGRLVARQRQVELGSMVGNDYVVRSGLKPGEQLIVSGVQKIADGRPVQVGAPPAPPAGAGAAPAGEGR